MNPMFPKNEHVIERVLRVGLGAALIYLTATSAIGAWGYLGIVPLVTGIIGSCPLYTALGISTCPLKRDA